jgi:uncharacterized protein (TIGR02145 family)
MKTRRFLLAASLLLAITFTISCGNKEDKDKFTDSRDGKKYKTVTIGSQIWMAENLNFAAEGSKCYEDKPENCEKYGRLYDWATALKACPSGWHLPDNEWTELMNFLASNKEDVRYEEGEETGRYYLNAGKYLKSKSGWRDDGNGTDEFGFSALPGGDGSSNGSFRSVDSGGSWWSARNYDSYYADLRHMSYDSDYAYWGFNPKSGLKSVRCIQDKEAKDKPAVTAAPPTEAAKAENSDKPSAEAPSAAVPAPKKVTFTDPRDGKNYKSVKIGEQVWMAENLNFAAEGSVCYDNKPENCEKYGRLYDWKTALKACPSGWHLPSDAEWGKLYCFGPILDGEGCSEPYESPTADKYLKARNGWEYGGGTDTFGFSALSGGFGYSDGSFSDEGVYGYWWSADEYEDNRTKAFGRDMYCNYDNDDIYGELYSKSFLLSVRCLQD